MSKKNESRDPRFPPYPEPTVPEPSMKKMQEWMFDSVLIEATDGCFVEEDGVCEHGYPSWFLHMGLI